MNALRERARGLAAGLATMVATMRGRTVAGPMTAGATHRVKGKAAKKKVRAARASPERGFIGRFTQATAFFARALNAPASPRG